MGVCDGMPTVIRTARVVRGTSGDDVLLGSTRSQTILGRAGNDRVCAGDGNDTVFGQAGDDTIHGEGRGDTVFGGPGADHLYGDILDDELHGGPAPDLVIGGHGVDAMYGGSGNDLLRGGTNRDCIYGQGGSNAASFATATPPGPSGSGIAGVHVDLNDPTKGRCPRGGSGRADGDGDGEALKGIQFVVGSAFGDSIRGRPGAGVDAGLGDDSCPDFGPGQAGCGGGDEAPAGTFAYVFESNAGTPPDSGLIVRAPQGVSHENINLSGSGGAVTVAVTGGALAAGPHCISAGSSAASCVPAAGPLDYVMVYGEDGADTINIGAGLPPDATVDADGGPGDDTLSGSGAGEVLFGGDSAGSDRLIGEGGYDALISEGGDPASGPDLLSGGPDGDQLVTDYPCAGHTFSGGAGSDVAGFARSAVGVRARLGGRATLAGGGCGAGSPTRILLDSEILEGTNLADRLIGSPGGETIWGRGGGDLLVGKAGADRLEGFAGSDLIDARDRRRDRRIDCGGGADRGARRDRADPRSISC
jgi:hypothetical protein